MNASHWQAEIDKFEQQADLHEPHRLQARMEALKMLAQLMRFGRTRYGIRQDFHSLLRHATALQAQLNHTNQQLFDQIRAQICQDELRGPQLRKLLDEYTTYSPNHKGFHHVANGLDSLINGIFETTVAPEPELDAVYEMIHFEMTPISVVLELADRIPMTAEDTFVDIGAGLGQFCLLTNLLTGIWVRGVEIEPAYVSRATEVAERILGRSEEATFVQTDARKADYSGGTIFFLYTPFIGMIFQQVMRRLHQSITSLEPLPSSRTPSAKRPLICTFGDITLEVAKLPWTQIQRPEDLNPLRLAIFEISSGD